MLELMARVEDIFSPCGSTFSLRLEDPLLKSDTQVALLFARQFLYKYIGRGEEEGSCDVCKEVAGT